MNATQQLQVIETTFNGICLEIGLNPTDLYNLVLSDVLITDAIKQIESVPASHENHFHVMEYIDILGMFSDDVFNMTACCLALWKAGANPDGIQLAGTALQEVEQAYEQGGGDVELSKSINMLAESINKLARLN